MVGSEMMSTNNDFFDLTGIDILVLQAVNRSRKNSVILTKSAAMKVFGDYNVIGEPVSFFGIDFTVSAIADDIPPPPRSVPIST